MTGLCHNIMRFSINLLMKRKAPRCMAKAAFIMYGRGGGGGGQVKLRGDREKYFQ